MYVVGFSRSNDLKGQLIRWATGGEWNHVWIGYDDPIWGGKWVAHAISEGVCVQRAELIPKKYDRSECFEVIGATDMAAGLHATRGYVNLAYDFKAVTLNGLLLALHRLTGIEWFNPIVDQNRVSCSEFVVLILQRAGFAAVQGKEAELVPPGGEIGLYPIVLANPADLAKIDFATWVSS